MEQGIESNPTPEYAPSPTNDGDGRTTHLTTARALLGMVLTEPIPVGPLVAATVPSSVLDLPISLAVEALVQHTSRCHDRLHCSMYSPPLHAYRRMRPEALRDAREKFNITLWGYPDHKLVAKIKREVLEKYAKLSHSVSSGTLLDRGVLSGFAHELGKGAPQVLAAVLWATRSRSASMEDLLRLLIPIIASGNGRKTADKDKNSGSNELRGLREGNRDLKRRLKEARHGQDQAATTLRARDIALSAARDQLEAMRRESLLAVNRSIGLESELQTMRLEHDEALSALEAARRDLDKVARAKNDLVRDARQARQMQRDFDVQRAELAREAADLRRELQQAEVELMAIPAGPDAVWNFLRTEEIRLEKEFLITSGGDKERTAKALRAHKEIKKSFLAAHESYADSQRPRLVPAKPTTRLLALGGSSEIGRSCYLLELGRHRILVDCGIKPSSREDLHPALEGVDRLDALILTHAHTDHIGWVPALIRRFPEIEIHCSAATAALLPVMLEDCRKHYSAGLARRNRNNRYSGAPQEIAEEYDARDMSRVTRRAIACDFDETIYLPFGGISLKFFRAGHILGAASVLVQHESGRRVFFSGDFSSFPQLTIPAAQWPDDLGSVDLMVLESTYGGRCHPSFDDSREDLLSFIKETASNDGSVILASFALGRAQELLKLLLLGRESGDLSRSIPIFVDGMINRINPIYERYGPVALSLADINEVTGEAERREAVASAQTTPSIIVTTSGMLTGGPAVEYARHLLSDAHHRIVFTGYQDESAPGKTMIDMVASGGPRTVRIEAEDGEGLDLKIARPAKHVQISSHADQTGLLEYSRRMRPKHIALVHGNTASQEELGRRLGDVHARVGIACGPDVLEVP